MIVGFGEHTIIMSLMILCFVPIMIDHSAEARTNSNDLGVVLSQTCLSYLKAGIEYDSPCPTYEEILLLHPDTSNEEISGGFVYKDGYLQRENPFSNDHYYFYRFQDDPIIWIDPPSDIRDKITLITIEASIPEYKVSGLSYVMENRTQYLGHTRWVDDRCFKASIDASQWYTLLGDTMRFMGADCNNKYTAYDTIRETYLDKTEFDIATSYKWKLDKWIQEIKEKCAGLCFEY